MFTRRQLCEAALLAGGRDRGWVIAQVHQRAASRAQLVATATANNQALAP
jgi:hypothetical protein